MKRILVLLLVYFVVSGAVSYRAGRESEPAEISVVLPAQLVEIPRPSRHSDPLVADIDIFGIVLGKRGVAKDRCPPHSRDVARSIGRDNACVYLLYRERELRKEFIDLLFGVPAHPKLSVCSFSNGWGLSIVDEVDVPPYWPANHHIFGTAILDEDVRPLIVQHSFQLALGSYSGFTTFAQSQHSEDRAGYSAASGDKAQRYRDRRDAVLNSPVAAFCATVMTLLGMPAALFGMLRGRTVVAVCGSLSLATGVALLLLVLLPSFVTP